MDLLELLQEKKKRIIARDNFYDFIHYTKRDYVGGWFHEKLSYILQKFYFDVKAGLRPRLIIQAPPRHGKSEQVSIRWPAWVFGIDPDIAFIGCSYSATLAEKFNRKIQRVIDSKEYKNIFPQTNLMGRNISTKQTWLRNSQTFEIVNRRGVYICAGIEGPITGSGGDIGLIDDPIKDAAEASSRKIRDNQWDWYQSTFVTRIENGGIILTQTRWHEDDLAGRLIKSQSEKWKVYNFEAIASSDEDQRKKGESLHEERWTLDQLLERKSEVGSRVWSSLYQGSPREDEGGLFKKNWFEIVKCAPRLYSVCRYWDRASSTSSSADYTCGVKIGKDKDGIFYILDVIRFRGTPLQVQSSIVNAATQDGSSCTVVLEQDPGQAGVVEIGSLTRSLSGFFVKSRKVDKAKEVRAMPLSAQCEAGNVKIVFGNWNECFLDELSFFPNGEHDDQVDAASGAFNYINENKFDIGKLEKAWM